MTTSAYPVHVDAQLDPHLSRWRWLVKWVLVIPHYVVLAFLWLAFVVLSIVAFFAILFTGRYPRAIFDFNVGVLRWSWRVAYYAYGALGTDRYPPFTLGERADYPAHLEVDYPEHLSRGLVLVKWWLLAIPHYLILALLLGGAGYAFGANDDVSVGGAGLIGLLVLVAGVVLLFTGRYPQPLYDFLLGLNRWVLRVAAYAGLMTDRYPPFRLDQGGAERGGHLEVASGPPPGGPVGYLQPGAPITQTPPGSQPSPGGWTAGRVVSLVLGCTLAFASLGVAAAGIGLVIADQTMRDDAGFLMSDTVAFSSDGYALTSQSQEIDVGELPAAVPQNFLGDLKLTAAADNGAPVFVGIAATGDVDAYLDGVRHSTVVDFTDADPVYESYPGDAPAAAPTGLDIWVTQSTGSGTQELRWPVEDGSWTVVVMNADGSDQVAVSMTAGADFPALDWVVAVLLTLAGVGLFVAVLLIAVPVNAASRGAAR